MKKIIVIIGLLVLISVLVSACGQNATTTEAPIPTQPPAEGEVATEPTQPESSEPKILRVRTTDDLVSMDPAFGVSVTDFFAVMPVYEGLIRQKPNEMDWELSLAESIELSDDGKEISFKLREGVMWQEGYGEVTTEDVKFSFERMIDPELGAYYADDWKFLDHVEIIDKYQGKIILTAPQASLFNSTLPLSSGSVICKKYVEEIGLEAYGLDPIGTGPYMFSEWRPNEKIILVRNPDYAGEQPYYDEIHLYPILDDIAAEVALDAGEIDVTWVALTSFDRYATDPSFETKLSPGLVFNWIAMNVMNPVLEDINVRQAIRYGIDIPSIITAAYFDKLGRANALIPESMLGYWADAPQYERDVEKAREYLAAAGYETLDLELAMQDTDEYKLWGQIIQQNLAEVGINVTINAMDSSSFWVYGADDPTLPQLKTGGYASLPDPVWFTMYWTCDQVAIYNLQNWCDPEFDALHSAALSEIDPEKRAELYIQAQQKMDEAVVSVWITHPPVALVWSKDVIPTFTPYGEYQLIYFRGNE